MLLGFKTELKLKKKHFPWVSGCLSAVIADLRLTAISTRQLICQKPSVRRG
jgi:hypothetical protein